MSAYLASRRDFAGTIQDVIGGLVIVAGIVTAIMWCA